jgi:plasmid stability protein
MTQRENISGALSVLQRAATRIRSIEDEAREALFKNDDPEAYRKKLQEKTELLMELPEAAGPYYEGMAEDIRAEFGAELKSLARRAAQALNLSSLFYMSALLYPEDYRDGDPNDLELLIQRLRTRYLP